MRRHRATCRLPATGTKLFDRCSLQKYTREEEYTMVKKTVVLIVCMAALAFTTHSYGAKPFAAKGENGSLANKSPRLGLWLAKKNELLAHDSAAYDLVMTAKFKAGVLLVISELSESLHPVGKFFSRTPRAKRDFIPRGQSCDNASLRTSCAGKRHTCRLQHPRPESTHAGKRRLCQWQV